MQEIEDYLKLRMRERQMTGEFAREQIHPMSIIKLFFYAIYNVFPLFIYLFIYLPFLGPLPWHMQIPRLGV